MKKLLIATIFSTVLLLTGCGTDYSGTYSGASGRTTLILNKDKTCSYDEYGLLASRHCDGTYEKSGNTITCSLDGYGNLYAEIKDDGGLYVTSDVSTWVPEYFSKN